MTFAKSMLWTLLLPMLFLACEDKMDKHYEVPDWLKGSAWEVLEDRGNYTIFLQGIELAGFKPIVEGKSILTIMAPNDAVFQTYLTSKGYQSIREMHTQKPMEVKKLIGFHLMYYSYSKSMLENFRPNGIDNTEYAAGLYYKHRTKSQDSLEMFTVTTTSPDGSTIEGESKQYAIYHTERFLPVFSHYLFNSKRIDAAYNYEYFYPNSSWTGQSGFNVSNASVNEYGIIADNGYVYAIDQVLEPLETIYTELKQRSSTYSRFLQMYDQYAVFVKDEDLTTNYGNGTDLYLRQHDNDLPPIACEWPVSDYTSIATLSAEAYSVFAPSDAAFENFFESYWKPGGYTSLEEVDPVAMSYILGNHVYSGLVVFPEEITRGDIKTEYGTKIDIDVTKVQDRKMCVNGAFYGLEEMKVPEMYRSVTGPAFREKRFSWYLSILKGSGLLESLMSPDVQITALMPSNQQLETEGISRDAEGNLMEIVDGIPIVLSNSKMLNIVNMHLVTGGNDLTAISGTKVIRTNIPFNYWYFNNGKITNSAIYTVGKVENAAYDPFINLKEITFENAAWNNGTVYEYSGNLLQEYTSESLSKLLSIDKDVRRPFYEFATLIQKSNLAGSDALNFISGRFIAFIPTNEAIRQAIQEGRIPGVSTNGNVTDKTQLDNYLKYYFISTDINGIVDYPYVGGESAGDFSTYRELERNAEGVTYARLNILDDGTKLSIKNNNGTVVEVVAAYDYFPLAYKDGCFHLLKDVIEYIK